MILKDLFGEKPAQTAVRKYAEGVANDAGNAGARYLSGRAAIPAGLAGVAAAPSIARASVPGAGTRPATDSSGTMSDGLVDGPRATPGDFGSFSEFRLIADCDWFGIWEG